MVESDTVPANAPASCPGTDSDMAGKSAGCAGCPMQKNCSSGVKTVDPAPGQIKEHLSGVKHKILVLSGKGGVGKSTVTAQLARSLAANGAQVGVLDTDMCGPSLPRIMGVQGSTVHRSNAGWSPVYTADDIAVMSIDFLLETEEDAVIWRGPKKNGMIKEFLSSVDWGDLDYLLVDTPPGTSDEHLSIVTLLRQSGIEGAVLVTTPQEVSLQDVRKELSFCKKLKVPVVGVVENMAYYTCGKCSTQSEIFPATTGGAAQFAESEGLALLCRLPAHPEVGRSGDQGLAIEQPGLVEGYQTLADHVRKYCGELPG